MRFLPPWALVFVAPLLSWTACEQGGPPATGNVAAPAVAVQAPEPPAPGRVVVLRLGDGVEVLRQRTLGRAVATDRVGPRHWRGRWEARDGRGRVLSRGRFRLPRRLHALFGDTGGPARAVDVALERPVVWLRVGWPAGARTLVVYGDHGRRRLGEVAL